MADDAPPVPPSPDDPTLDVRDVPTAAPGANPTREQIAGFRILGKLGEGGMGIVYEAEQQNPKRRVALKVIRGGRLVDEVSLRLFRRETETLARLAHPTIAAIYEAGRTEDGLDFFTMELVPGRTLSTWVREKLGGERPVREQVRERLRLFVTIARAVHYAHQRGVIHRDLKPSNLVVTPEGAVKVLDFGLARVTDGDLAASLSTDAGAIRGTLPYMSPEQTRGDSRDIDLRSDVYALGVVLFEMLTCRLPYDTAGVPLLKALQTICEAAPRSLRASAPGVPLDPDLETIVGRALEKEPDRRYASADALAEDVERLLANRPILAHPPSASYQVRKLVSRHKGRFVALGTIALLLVGLLVSFVVQSRRVRIERDRATAEAKKAEAINRFLIDALGGADPWRHGGRSVTLLDALHGAQRQAHAAFANEPAIEAAVLQTIGNTLAGLGEFAVADSILRHTIALRTGLPGSAGADIAQALSALSVSAYMQARYPEAESLARDAVARYRVSNGEDSPETATALANLAIALASQAKNAEAKTVSNQMLAIVDRQRGHPTGNVDLDEVESVARSALAAVALAENDTTTMLAQDAERVRVARRVRPSASGMLENALADYAVALSQAGRLAAAESTLREAIDVSKAVYGPDHPMTATSIENLGGVYFRMGRLDRTSELLAQALEIRRRALGNDSEPVGRTYANMGAVAGMRKDFVEAERCDREALRRLLPQLGPDHPDVAYVRFGIATALFHQKRYAEAEPLFRVALAADEKALGAEHVVTRAILKRMAEFYRAWGRPALAASYESRLGPPK